MEQVQSQVREAALQKELQELKDEVEELKDGMMKKEPEIIKKEQVDTETVKVSKRFTNLNISESL